MRLINVDTLELEEFFDDSIPDYAILSHTWGNEEVSFQDLCWLNDYEKNRVTYASLDSLILQLGQNLAERASALRRRAGFDKIVQSARLAQEEYLSYVWVDTCCIDKTSSAELSEAINSMYRWYEKYRVCFAFLSDVVHCHESSVDEYSERNTLTAETGFEQSRWFTRGWTLQELIAPHWVEFLDCHWQNLGSKHQLCHQIERITGIPYMILAKPWSDIELPAAQKMSWASRRETSRREDIAYCLLGLFDINMPLLYGEGDKASIRLQREMIKENTDQSLFAWGLGQGLQTRGSILATSPIDFSTSYSDTTRNMSFDKLPVSISAFEFTNRGLEIALRVLPLPRDREQEGSYCKFYLAILDYAVLDGHGDMHNTCILLHMVDEQSNKLRDGDVLFKCGTGPVAISQSRIPHDVARRRLVILDSSPMQPVIDSVNIRVRWPSNEVIGESCHAQLVEVYSPAFNIRNDPGWWGVKTPEFSYFFLQFALRNRSGVGNEAADRQVVVFIPREACIDKHSWADSKVKREQPRIMVFEPVGRPGLPEDDDS